MEQCEYYDKCGRQDGYECTHGGEMPENSSTLTCHNALRHNLEKVALTIDEDINSLEASTRVTNEVLKIEFTI